MRRTFDPVPARFARVVALLLALSASPASIAGQMDPTFDEEFHSLSLWNGSSGTWMTTYPYVSGTGNGGTQPGDGEQEWYVNNRYRPTSSVVPWTVHDGMLSLTAERAGPSIQPRINNYKFTSGMLDSYHAFSQTYGFFEIRAKTPAGRGLWSAFWLLPEKGSWPPEIDVMEVLGNDPATVHTTVHTGARNTSQGQANRVADTSSGFHTYAVDWRADHITWYFDDRPIYRIATPADLHQPMYMLLNLAVGGAWPGSPDASTRFPSSLDVRWVRVYRSNPHAR